MNNVSTVYETLPLGQHGDNTNDEVISAIYRVQDQ